MQVATPPRKRREIRELQAQRNISHFTCLALLVRTGVYASNCSAQLPIIPGFSALCFVPSKPLFPSCFHLRSSYFFPPSCLLTVAHDGAGILRFPAMERVQIAAADAGVGHADNGVVRRQQRRHGHAAHLATMEKEEERQASGWQTKRSKKERRRRRKRKKKRKEEDVWKLESGRVEPKDRKPKQAQRAKRRRRRILEGGRTQNTNDGMKNTKMKDHGDQKTGYTTKTGGERGASSGSSKCTEQLEVHRKHSQQK